MDNCQNNSQLVYVFHFILFFKIQIVDTMKVTNETDFWTGIKLHQCEDKWRNFNELSQWKIFEYNLDNINIEETHIYT